VRPGVKVKPTVVAMETDSTGARDSSVGSRDSTPAVAER